MIEQESKIYGVTSHRSGNWQAQLRINGKTRYLGIYPTAEEAGEIAQNARVYLQEYFPDPFSMGLRFELGVPAPETERLRAVLEEECAPTYKHGAKETPDLESLVTEVQKASDAFQRATKRLLDAIRGGAK